MKRIRFGRWHVISANTSEKDQTQISNYMSECININTTTTTPAAAAAVSTRPLQQHVTQHLAIVRFSKNIFIKNREGEKIYIYIYIITISKSRLIIKSQSLASPLVRRTACALLKICSPLSTPHSSVAFKFTAQQELSHGSSHLLVAWKFHAGVPLQMSTYRLSAPWQFSCCPLSEMPNAKGALAKHWRFVFVSSLWATT